MVAAVRRGASARSVARRFRVSHSTVRLWVRRAQGRRLDRVDWGDRPDGCPIPVNRTPREREDLVLTLRRELRETSDLGEFGAQAIRSAWVAWDIPTPPSLRTIGRILQRRGALDGKHRIRRPPPPRGWYLPGVSQGREEIDSFDIIQGLVIQGGIDVEVLTGISLHGGLAASWPQPGVTATTATEALMEHWRQFGLPAYAQFDNDTRFQGPHQHTDAIGRVTRLCLSLGVVPVFVPPREPGFQAAIESFNGRWQSKVWARFHHESLAELQARSARYLAAGRVRSAVRIEAAPPRQPFPIHWRLDLTAPPRGRIVFLRRTSEGGEVTLLGRRFDVEATWPHRLVKAEVDLDAQSIHFYALRRQQPHDQPLLREVPYTLPQRRS